MIVIPAIDIMDGCVVRLTQGRSNKVVYSRSPVKTAIHWQAHGAEFLHIVDLDGAATGKPKNIEQVKQILAQVNLPLEFGGGIRDIRTVKKLLDIGVSRVVLGTKAIQDRKFLEQAFKKFKEKVIVSVDAQNGKLFIQGWKKQARRAGIWDFIVALKRIGFSKIIYTDISKDGTLAGPNFSSIRSLLKKTGLSIIASGGISSLDDLRRLRPLGRLGLEGVIIGKALYEARFTLTQALKVTQ